LQNNFLCTTGHHRVVSLEYMRNSLKKKSLVTGVAGFIGSHLAEEAIKAGHAVIGIDSLTDYYPLI
jgi:nucleoside-diphosphate-sugar epimerase